MRKTVIILSMLLVSGKGWADVEINEKNFPDNSFRNWILSQPYGKDGVLTDKEIADITEIRVANKNIHDLTGIAYFTALESLISDRNQLKSVDVSKNQDLAYLRIEWNQLASLDVSGNRALRFLMCGNNHLTELNTSGCTALERIRCSGNQLHSAAMDSLIKNLPSVRKPNCVS